MNRYQTMPPLSAEDFRLLEASILADGIVTPIIVDEDGAIIDGHHRHDIAERHGLFAPVELREGLTESEKVALSISLNVARRHLSREERRQIIEASLKAQPEKSNREHARTLGVDHKTVQSVREPLESRGEIPHVEERTDSLGRQQPAARPAPSHVIGPVPSEPSVPNSPASLKPEPDWERINAEQEAKNVVDALLAFEPYQYENRRRIFIEEAWPLGKDAVPPAWHHYFTPEKLRAAAEGLVQLATDLENHHDQH